jgi:hypothetical protein
MPIIRRGKSRHEANLNEEAKLKDKDKLRDWLLNKGMTTVLFVEEKWE